MIDRDLVKAALALGVVGLLLGVVLAASLTTVAGSAAAQGYYNNSTPTGNQSDWLDDREDGGSIENVANLLTEVADWIIGDTDEGGAKGLLVGVLLMGLFLGFMTRSRLGTAAGATLGMAALGGFALSSIVPMWIYAIALLALGLVLTAVVIRVFR